MAPTAVTSATTEAYTTPPVFISAERVNDLIDFKAAAATIRDVYAQCDPSAHSAGRVIARGDSARLRALAAVLPDGSLMGAKLHAQAADGDSSFLIALFSAQDGVLQALVDGRAVTAFRTGATSAVALDILAPSTPLILAVLGTGAEARAHLRAVAAIRNVQEAHAYSPTQSNRERFAADMEVELGFPVHAAPSAEAAVEASGSVIAAARSRDETPVFAPDALPDGALVISVGSTVPEQRELDPRVLARAGRIIADEPTEVLTQSGDCLAAEQAGIELRTKMFSLAELVQGSLPGRVDDGQTTVFKSVGSALQDVAVGKALLQASAANHADLPHLPIYLQPKDRRG